MVKFEYENIPEELKKLKRWVLWKKKETEKGKTTKIPVNAKNGYGAKSNDPDTWVSFYEAKAVVDKYECNGIGFMLGDGYFGIDLDNHEDESGNLEMPQKEFTKLADEFIKTLRSYTEYSQSGNGLHIICKGHLPEGNRRKGNVEMYDENRFFVMTGKKTKDSTDLVHERTQEVISLYKKYLEDKKTAVSKDAYVYTRENTSQQRTSTLTNEEVITKASASSNGNTFVLLYEGQWEGMYRSQSEADMAFCNLLAFWCGRDKYQMDEIFRNSKLYREKWDMQRGRLTYGEKTLQQACDNCKDVYYAKSSTEQEYNIETGEVIQKKEYELTDTGNAERYIEKFGSQIKYNYDNKCWMVFDGATWRRDVRQLTKAKADILIQEMKIEAVSETNPLLAKEKLKNVKHLASSNGKEAMLKEAMHILDTATVNADYDKDNYLLNCKNGVVDLKSGKLIEHNRAYMMSKNTNIEVDMKNQPKRFIQFLNEIFDNNQELVDFIQKAMGYTLTGDNKEQCFFQCYGDGSNGKSVLLDIIYDMLGDYAINTQVTSILAKSGANNGANSEIARMNGARFVRTNEPDDGNRFAEGLVKQLVGGDVTTARYLYGQEFEFKPIFKLWMATNYRVEVRGTDFGIWRRIKLVPFKVIFEGDKVDKDLPAKLHKELPQILGWAIQGCLKWQKEGLDTPKSIEAETRAYQRDMDKLAKFCEDCTRTTLNGKEKASDVYREYCEWAKMSHEYIMTQCKFGIEMSKRFEKRNIGGSVHYIGFVLNKHDESYTYVKEDD